MKAPSSLSRLNRAFAFTHAHRGRLVLVLLLTILVAGASSAEPLVMKYIIDALGDDVPDALRAMLLGLGALVALGIMREAATVLSNLVSWRTRLDIHYGLLDATVERIHRLPSEYHRREGVGAIMNRLDRSIQGFIGALSEISFNVLPAIAYLGIAIFTMLRLDWRLTLVVLFFAPLPGLIATFAAPTQVQREKTLFERWARIYSRFNEVLAGIVTVRSFAMERTEKERFLRDVSATNEVVVRGVRFDSRVGALQNAVVLLARASAIGIGGYLVLRGDITVGTVVAFLGYVTGLFGPVQGLTSIYRVLRTASVSLDQVFSLLDMKDHVEDAPDAKPVQSLAGYVRFDHVSFGYNDCGTLLHDIDFEVKPGEMVALVGPSGAGKTTLMALLQRFYDPRSGAVLVDGSDVRSLKQDQLRRQIGVVLQDAMLFNESVRENIAYGRPSATQAQIEAAAKAANAHGFITRMENGYDTIVGERGGRLSAGERQRVAIARALLKDPPILIFDEATAALDAATEALVQEAIEKLIRGRTTFIIAHRLSTVVHADRILVLKKGGIVESGTHAELLARKGHYYALVRRQTRGLLHAAA
ncbi:MAG: ATP-binding cassette domain-containing protein [Chitinivibrionales bacterium]|nr:ATP-binding cassette domain-containing protein [Chitinivibrionales bacterium]